jgi:RND superfamily putative drug exporter
MASLLYRLGRLAARRAWLVLGAWLAVLALAGGAFAAFGGTLTSTVTIPDTPTQRVADQLADRFPDASGGTATVIFRSEDGSELTDDQRAGIADVLEDVGRVDGVAGTVDPFATQQQVAQRTEQAEQGRRQLEQARERLEAGERQLAAARQQLEAAPAVPEEQRAQLERQEQELAQGRERLEAQEQRLDDGAALLQLTEGIRQVSRDGSTALAQVQFDAELVEVPVEVRERVLAALTDDPVEGVEVLPSSDISQEIPKVFGPAEAVGLAVAAVVLLVMLGTFVTAGLPLLNALLGVGVGVLASLSLSGVVDMLSVSPALGVMLGLAVGIDYSLFIINRHRKQLARGMDVHESIGLANGTSGNAVVFAGSTVLIALLALNVVGIGFLGVMGTVGAICVLVAILVAITLTPAMLGLVGHRALSRKERGRLGQHAAPTATTAASAEHAAVRPMSTVRAWATVVLTVVVLLVVAIPALSMRLGLNTATSEPEDSDAYRSYSTVERAFGPGANGPLLVVATLDEPVTDDTLVAEQLRLGELLRDQGDVTAVAPIGASEDQELLAFQVVPATGPSDEETEQLVRDVRDLRADGVSSFGVAGATSGNIDVSAQLSSALPVYLAVVVGLSLLILVLVFRSILVPLTATLGFVLSLFATFGGLTAIFQWGWLGSIFGVHDPGPVLSFLPVILIGVLFGLAMDYQLFLVSGMREAYVHGASARVAVQQGFHAGRSVVVAAALIMVSVFAGFIFADSGMIKSVGFGLAFGVLVDAFVVRILLVPAVMHLLGESAWWIPRWLDRLLPDMDVEGAALEREHPVDGRLHEDSPTR